MSKAAELAALIGSGQAQGNKNLIINGAMNVAQRGTVTSAVHDSFGGPDRYKISETGDTVFTMSQDSDTPTGEGFANSLKLDVTTADSSLAAGDFASVMYNFEGQNLQTLKKGTSSAKSVTLSFYIKSTITGTYIVQLYDNDNNRQVSKSYTVSSADTWEKKTITFPADTTGAFDDDNALSLLIRWWFAAGTTYSSGTLATTWASFTAANAAVGQVNAVNSTSNNIFLTGIQLEIGEVATPFEHESFDLTLDKCKRYYQKSFAYGTAPANDIAGVRMSEMPPSDSLSYAGAIVYLDKPMRVTPTCQAYNPQSAPANSGAYVNDLVNGTVTTEYAVSSVSATTSKLRFFLSTAPTTGGNPYGCNWTAASEL